MTTYTIAEIAKAIGADPVGDINLRVTGLTEPQDAKPDSLALASNPKYVEGLSKGNAQAALLWADADWQSLGLVAAILPKRPRFAMSPLTAMFDLGQGIEPGIHPTALIDPTALLGADVSIGAYTIIGARAQIGAGSRIGPQCYVGADARIGASSVLREQVSIGARVQIGDRFWAQPGARIGGDGYSYVTPEKSDVEEVRETLGDTKDAASQTWHRIHSLGGVLIGDDVEIGANGTVDNGTIRPTRVGDRTKIDNLVHIAHNVVVGDDCLLCGQTGIAGSAKIGNGCVLGGQVGIADNITIGDRVICTASSKVVSSIPPGRVVMGYPAMKMDLFVEVYKALRRLPRMARDVAEMKKSVSKSGASD